MSEILILPLPPHAIPEGYSEADEECAAIVSQWFNIRIDFVREVWRSFPEAELKVSPSDLSGIVDQIINILTHRLFNFQSKKYLLSFLPEVKENLNRKVRTGEPLNFFLLYNGGYRACSFPDTLSLNFEPDQTELMLLYQISLLHKKISAVYAPGIEFSIVINNGVAHWVNDIPLASTENYVNKLRHTIDLLGAAGKVSILMQSELLGFEAGLSFEYTQQISSFSEKEHKIVERFLGRSCSVDEARYRAALYMKAEAKWGSDLSFISASKDFLFLRQVAHPSMLSFRPFPGGAIRSQNGTFGFQFQQHTLIPKLITSESVRLHGVKCVSYSLPWSTDADFLMKKKSVDA